MYTSALIKPVHQWILPESTLKNANVVQSPIRLNLRCEISNKHPTNRSTQKSQLKDDLVKASLVVPKVLLGIAISMSVNSISLALEDAVPGASLDTTAEKADELLKAADDLATFDSPPRFGPSRTESDVDETSTLTRKSGSGSNVALRGIQEPLEGAFNTAKELIAGKPDISEGVEKSDEISGEFKVKQENVPDKISESIMNAIQGD